MSMRALAMFWLMTLLAVAAALMALFTGRAHAEAANCVTTQTFLAEMNHGGMFTTPIPARNMPAALALMEAAKKQAPVDAAWYVETREIHGSGVTYAHVGCITASLFVAAKTPEQLWQLRGILLGERL